LWRRAVVVVARRAVVTHRDLAVLTFAGEQYGLPMATVAELLARHAASATRPLGASAAATVARRTAARLEAGGYAERLQVAGEVWLVPTSRGLALAREQDEPRPYEVWQPAAWKLEHVAAVARLRLALADQYPQARWESERSIRRRWAGSGARVRYADAGLHFPNGTAVGIECELHVKKPHLYQGIALDQDPTWTAGVWWYCPAAQVALLRRRLDDAGAPGHQIHALPEGVAR
jgi:hypothetical protein